jgi:hypothetical protein
MEGGDGGEERKDSETEPFQRLPPADGEDRPNEGVSLKEQVIV